MLWSAGVKRTKTLRKLLQACQTERTGSYDEVTAHKGHSMFVGGDVVSRWHP